MDDKRTARLAVALREELSEIIGFEMSDPRVRGIDVTHVEVSQDGEHALVRLAMHGQTDESAARELTKAIAALDKGSGFLRHELAARLDLRRVPELRFTADRHPDTDERIEILLKRAQKSRGLA